MFVIGHSVYILITSYHVVLEGVAPQERHFRLGCVTILKLDVYVTGSEA